LIIFTHTYHLPSGQGLPTYSIVVDGGVGTGAVGLAVGVDTVGAKYKYGSVI
jgi:hypothetical protein